MGADIPRKGIDKVDITHIKTKIYSYIQREGKNGFSVEEDNLHVLVWLLPNPNGVKEMRKEGKLKLLLDLKNELSAFFRDYDLTLVSL